MVSYASTIRALAEVRISSAKLKTLAEHVYAGCDEKDGLKDGLIDDPRKCGFTPSLCQNVQAIQITSTVSLSKRLPPSKRSMLMSLARVSASSQVGQ